MERGVIAEVMDGEGVAVEEIPRETPFDINNLGMIENSSRRYFSCRAFAKFNRHANCSRHWGSVRAWCIIDLKEQRIIYRFDQDCQHCEESVPPEFDEESVERMADYAVKTFLRRSGRLRRNPFDFRDLGDALDGATDGPHDQQRCGKCRRLGHSCQ